MVKPICIGCNCFYRPKRNGVVFEECMPEGGAPMGQPEGWRPYKLWRGDLWKCPKCGHELISGVASLPLAEHYQPEYKDLAAKVTLHVYDC